MCVPICVMGCSIPDDHRACPVPQGRIGEDPRRERLPDACHVGGVGGRPCSVKKCWRRGRELNPRPTDYESLALRFCASTKIAQLR